MTGKTAICNSKGFSLVEILVASAMFLGLTMIILTFYQSYLRGMHTLESKYNQVSVMEELREVLLDPLSCEANLKGKPTNTVLNKIIQVRGEIDDSTNNEGADPTLSDWEIFEAEPNGAGPSYGNNKVKFLSFEFKETLPIPPNSKGKLIFETIVENPKDVHAHKNKKTINISVMTDNNGKIKSCNAENMARGLTVEKVCKTLGGTFQMRGNGGAGACHSLEITSKITVNGNVTVKNVFNNVNSVKMQNMDNKPIKEATEVMVSDTATTRNFCRALGGTYVENGRGANDDCRSLQIRRSLSLKGILTIRGGELKSNFNTQSNNTYSITLPAGSPAEHEKTNVEPYCKMLGGSFNHSGRNGSGDCNELNLNGGLTIYNDSGDIGGLFTKGLELMP